MNDFIIFCLFVLLYCQTINLVGFILITPEFVFVYNKLEIVLLAMWGKTNFSLFYLLNYLISKYLKTFGVGN